MNKKKSDVAWFVEVSKNARIDINLYQPIPLTKAKLEMVIRGFEATGLHVSSSEAKTLAYVIRYCELNNISFTLTAHPKKGYELRAIRGSNTKNVMLLSALEFLYNNSHVNDVQVEEIVLSILHPLENITDEEKILKDKLLKD